MDLLNDVVKRVHLCICSILNTCLYCEVGQAVTNQFGEFQVELGKCKWYLLDMTMQRNYLVFWANTQKPIYIFGYGQIAVQIPIGAHVHLHECILRKIILYVKFWTQKFGTNSKLGKTKFICQTSNLTKGFGTCIVLHFGANFQG